MEFKTESEIHWEPSFCSDPFILASLPAFCIGSSSLESVRSSGRITSVVKELVKQVKEGMVAVNFKVRR